MVHWEQLCPGGFRFVWEDSLFRPSTDSFLLSSLPRLRPGLRVCELGCRHRASGAAAASAAACASGHR